jgi:hypothetical protein
MRRALRMVKWRKGGDTGQQKGGWQMRQTKKLGAVDKRGGVLRTGGGGVRWRHLLRPLLSVGGTELARGQGDRARPSLARFHANMPIHEAQGGHLSAPPRVEEARASWTTE